MKKQIIVVSGNEGKIKEIKKIFKEYEIISIKEFGIEIDIDEDQETFEENAIKKAVTVSQKLNGKLCLADDSGIEIEYLNGFPGVRTKRWFKGTDRDRNLAIIEKLKGIPKEKRKIKFITSIAISDGSNTNSVTASIDGYVSDVPKGKNGFGFDEIFELEDGRTLAELTDKEKNNISSRRKALEKIINILN